MMIFALGISISDSNLAKNLLGGEKASSYVVTTFIRVICTAVSCCLSAIDIGFVNLLNLTGSLLGATLTFIFPVTDG